jgi:diphthine-ammonia ligase
MFYSRCCRLGLTSLSYLWRRDQSELLQEMIDSGMKCVLVKCAAMGLDQTHLGKSLQEVQPHLEQLVRLS